MIIANRRLSWKLEYFELFWNIFMNMHIFTFSLFFSFPLFLLLTLIQMSPFPPLCLATSRYLLPSGSHLTVVCIFELCIHILWLIPSPSSIQPPSPFIYMSIKKMLTFSLEHPRNWLFLTNLLGTFYGNLYSYRS